MMDQFMDVAAWRRSGSGCFSEGLPHRAARRGVLAIVRPCLVLAVGTLIAVVSGCRSDISQKGPKAGGATAPAEDWKRDRSSTVGTDFNKVPPGQTISAPLGVDLP